jgi:hypothetical protein
LFHFFANAEACVARILRANAAAESALKLLKQSGSFDGSYAVSTFSRSGIALVFFGKTFNRYFAAQRAVWSAPVVVKLPPFKRYRIKKRWGRSIGPESLKLCQLRALYLAIQMGGSWRHWPELDEVLPSPSLHTFSKEFGPSIRLVSLDWKRHFFHDPI